MSKAKVDKFNEKSGIKTHLCGKVNLLNFYKKKTFIKDLDGKILYEGRGNFQQVLEKAVKHGVALPKANLRNQTFKGLYIPNAKIRGASFEGSVIDTLISVGPKRSYISSPVFYNADLREVSFERAKISSEACFAGSDVEKTDFDGHKFNNSDKDFLAIKNFNKAYNVRQGDLNAWEASKVDNKETSKKLIRDNIIVNPAPIKTSQYQSFYPLGAAQKLTAQAPRLKGIETPMNGRNKER